MVDQIFANKTYDRKFSFSKNVMCNVTKQSKQNDRRENEKFVRTDAKSSHMVNKDEVRDPTYVPESKVQ